MTSSGTYSFAPSVGALVLDAFGRVQLRPAAIVTEHLARAAVETNLLLVEWSNRQVNLWKSELIPVTLTQGVPTYTLPARVIDILIAYVSTTSGGTTTDRVVTPISTTEYGAIPTKATQGPPSTYWFNRLIVPQISLWLVPDGNGPYTLNMQCAVQVQDANLAGGETPDIPYRWNDAFVAGLAHRLSRHYAPALEQLRKTDAQEAWTLAASEDTEAVPLSILPGLSSYYR